MNQLMKQWGRQTYIILMLFAACTTQKPIEPEKPQNLLPLEKMVEVLTQMHLADALVMSLPNATDSADIHRKAMYNFIYKKLQVNEQDFQASFNYYKMVPEQIDSIYAHVIDELGKLESQKSVTQ